jgi:hypothetical protein
MALALEAESHVWQKVKIALANAKPDTQLEFKGLREYLATHKGLPDLQIIQYSDADTEGAAGKEGILGVAFTLYGWYAAGNTAKVGTTASWWALYDNADNDSTGHTAVAMRSNALGQHGSFIFGDGLAFATDLTIAAVTAIDGATASAAGDGFHGFVIVGA